MRRGKGDEGGEQGVAGMWEDTLEELDTAVDGFIRFLELRMESEQMQEIEIVHRDSQFKVDLLEATRLFSIIWRSSLQSSTPRAAPSFS